MPFSGLLEKLKGLFTPAFLIASATPLFCFILLNFLILSQCGDLAGDWVGKFLLADTAPKTAVGALIVLSFFVAAYVFSTLSQPLREMLEGEHLPKPLANRLLQSELARLASQEQDFSTARINRRQIRLRKELWLKALANARKQGSGMPKCDYPDEASSHKKIENLESKRWRTDRLATGELEESVTALVADLALNHTNLGDAQHEDASRLDRAHRRLVELITYAEQRAEADYIRLFNEKEFNFSRFTVRPTRVGNIAESVRSYAESRYGMNLDFCWTRLQKVLQAEKAFYDTLQDAKTQVDFLVSMFWLTAGSAAFWLVVLPVIGRSWLLFAAVWLLGPVLVRLIYLMAAQNYRSFADLLRSSIDLFRFKLLGEFHAPLPEDTVSEQRLWDSINRKLCYGETVLLAYKPSADR